ncbi:D-alanyl-D-alanine carboxypeptidase family protein [Nereida sp. MMG025]|uniref:D-alanyl-D-alanine carboxypeptidase family protein n=1 Tax=Nereida sp. MMG025 TaxID=2909981 RepID=UPI001F376246|nr:D-alanyl-D-alanine carboxypeptidase family protein [Nereida sp. MMG025]MCF6443762.1 D-alanyl-D-alanine carboxypeptidase [Nereida sp. MMG025]
MYRFACIFAFVIGLALPAAAFETRATAAYVIDQTTGTVLLSKNANEALPPASMSKLMTLYMAFDAIADGRLQLDEELLVSQHAMSFGGSTLFLRAGERVKVEDLIRGIIVLSGNDACVVIAEALSRDGTEAGFAQMMTTRARELGMTNSTFANSSGWPAAGHRMSMKDLAILADRLIKDYPTYYPLFSQKEFLFDPKESENRLNRNPLLGLGIGADGLKTGHTREAGYGLVGSAQQGDRRIIFVLTGLQSSAARAEESEKIVNWAFRQFAQKELIKAGTVIAEAEVWNGAETTVGLVPAQDLSLLLPVLSGNTVDAQVRYTGPVEAPISAGDQLAELVIALDDLPETRLPLVAANDVPAAGFVGKMRTATGVLVQQVTASPAAPLQAPSSAN